MKTLKRILLITYFFPPTQSSASMRTGGIAKYLNKERFEITVITTQRTGKTEDEYNIIRTAYPGFFYFLKANSLLEAFRIINHIVFYPVNKNRWIPYAVEAISKLLLHEKYDVIISSGAPFAVHVIASKIKLRFNIPWIADYRDLWSENYDPKNNILNKFFAKRLEMRTMNNVDAITTVSEPLKEKLKGLHKNIPVYTITNGFDPEEISDVQEEIDNEFTISYTGLIYLKRHNYELFFIAIKELIREKALYPDRVKVGFWGRFYPEVQKCIKKHGIEDIVKQYGRKDRDFILQKQRKSQLLLIFSWNNPNQKGNLSGKIFEYFAAKRPIINIGGEADDSIAKKIEETNSGMSGSSLEEIKDIIANCYREYIHNGKVAYHGKSDEISKYSQVEMAKRFADIIDFVCNK